MKVVIIISGLRGVFHASLEIARRLEKKGAEVILGSPTDIRDWINPYSYSFQLLPSMHIPKDFDAEFHLKYLDAIGKVDADIFIVDLECPVYTLACLAKNKRTFVLNHFLPIPTFGDAPIPNRIVTPGEGFMGTNIGWNPSWVLSRSKFWVRAIQDQLKNRGKDKRSLLVKLGRAMGLNEKEYLYSKSLLPGPFLLFSKVPLLHITASQMDFSHRLRTNEKYVGPMIFLERADSIDSEMNSRIDRIISKAKVKGKKLIYCSLSSYKAVDESFLKKLVLMISEKKDWELVVGLGSKSKNPEGVKAENIHFFPWVPSWKILPEADCAIITAGFHTIHECINFEVPMLSFSLGITDQNGFQARIKSKKLGLTGDVINDSQSEIASKLTQLLSDEEIRLSLKKMKSDFEEYVDGEVLEKVVLN